MPEKPDLGPFDRGYRRLVWLVGTLVVVILAVLIGREFVVQVDRGLELRLTQARERLVAVEAVVTAADAHVTGMRAVIERDLARPLPDAPVVAGIAARTEAVPVDLLGAPTLDESHRHGLLFGVPERYRSNPNLGAEVTALLALVPVQAAAHAAQPYFKWSYFFSAGRDLMAIYPWADLGTFLPGPDPVGVFDGYYGYDVYRLTTAEFNSSRSAIWVPVYFDAGGSGLMVSHNAPVMVGGIERGMIGTDILLGVLTDLLRGPDGPDLSIVIADQAGMVVADTAGVAARTRDVTAADALLPAGAGSISADGFERFGSTFARRIPVHGAPWQAFVLIPVSAVAQEAVLGILPLLLYLLALAATMTTAFLLIGRRYVQPAFELVRTIESQAVGEGGAIGSVPPEWRPYTNRVMEVFTRLRETIARLHLAETKSAAIINVALDAVVTTDADGIVVDFNPAAERMFGISGEAATGRSIGSLIVPQHLRDAHEAGMARHARTGRSTVLGRRIELDALHASGRVFPVEIQIHQLGEAGGIRYAAYIRDLTDQRQTAAALKDQQEKLYQAEKLTAMGSLLAGLAHELNNPLAIVTAQTSLLEELAETDPVRSRATKIRVAAERCGRIVRTFLAMARKQTPVRRSVDLRAIVDGALEILAYGLRSSGVEVRTDVAADLPPVEADPDQLSQVVINMIVNAQQAFGDRSGERIVFLGLKGVPGMLELTIADNGPGIPEDIRDRVFEPFFTTKPVGVGTGIGLAVCRSIIEAHGGRIAVSDRPGGGALFRITLPTGAGQPILPPIGQAGDHAAPSERRAGLLIVDDETEVAESLAGFLELEGHTVTLAHSIADGLAAVSAGSFDAVFCDLRMPGGGGTSFWAEVAARDPILAGRFVFVTGDMVAGPETIQRAASGRPVRLLEKPFDRAAVRKALVDVLPAAGPVIPA